MNDFPSRVTLFEDGVYRWSYDMDMRRNRYMINHICKIIGLVLGIPTIFVAAMVLRQLVLLLNQGTPREEMMFFLGDDLTLLCVVGGLLAGVLLLTFIIYAIAAAVMGGCYRLRFEMDETAVALVRKPKTMNAVNALSTINAVVALAVGKPGEAFRAGSTLAVANSTGISRFESTRRVKFVPKCDLLDMREFFGMNQIYVPKEDYGHVKSFILERIPEKARRRSEQ